MIDSSRKPPPYSPFSPPEPRKPLTETQEEVARLLAHGRSVRQIGSAMELSESTVDYHIAQIALQLRIPDPDPDIRDDFSVRECVQAWAFWTYRRGAA